MVRTSCSGRDIANVLQNHGFRRAGRTGHHLKLRYERPETDEVRIVTIPMKTEDDIPTGMMRSIANQCGANDFHAWCQWIDDNR